ncbi:MULTISPECIES: DUF4906 domain-containing protein [Butyricimonas]|uniref:DUF4906 domain-containing protein n=1 Tax=Butyricimonas TaxID=574697 RepID=UPI0007FB29F2|nr:MULTISPECIES: DUF4906 domain-containing protein [Butyricimonas]
MKRKITIYTLLCLLFVGTFSCRDDLYIDDERIGEGECVISGTMKFKPFTPTLNGNSRSAGDAIKAIESLCVLLYDEGENLVNKYLINDYTISDPDPERTGENVAESSTPRATFQLTIPYGKYYIYAVANMGDLSDYRDSIQTVKGLKNIPLQWDEKNVSANNQMFGHFFSEAETASDDNKAPLVTINKNGLKLQAWVRRAASKVTVAYDGTNLKDGVSIYIMAVSIKDIPRSCLLGTKNTPDHVDSLIRDGEIIKYFEGDVQPGLDNFITDYKAVVSKKEPIYGSDHSETAEALFFYENMQGAGEDMPDKQQDANNDGKLDYPGLPGDDTYRLKDDVPCGTYIEVDAIYRSENTERPGVGIIKYRFMLGKNITTDYNAERNHHYKLTLKFNNFANDYDWHIEYKEQVLEVTEPKVMNYQGKVFIPEYRPGTANYNYGHHFEDNTIMVTSYIENSEGKMVNWEIEYDEDGDGVYTKECSWLEPVITDGYLPYIKNISFKVTPNKEEIDIDKLLQDAPQKGTEAAPYNLANPGETVAPANAKIKCTANCYIVDAPGYYILPLVYGNAYHNFQPNENAYTYTGSYTGDQILPKFKDYLGREITNPFIKGTTAEYTPLSAFLIWQDENNLIPYTVWNPTADIKYLPDAYEGKGGILFRIEKSNIKQGNAVIGVSTGTKEVGTTTIPSVMWSWHIWVTNFSYLEEDDKNIEVTSHDPSQKFKLLPVNLGWCSGHGDKIKYYKARKCKVKVTAGAKEKVIELEQKSHIAFTRGDNPYYQWGRKDPFVGATGNVQNKRRYYSVDWPDDANPPMLSATTTPDGERYTTRGAIDAGVLIQNPHKWHNPRRKVNTGTGYPYLSDNEIYRNLWQGRIEVQPGSPSLKTIYDPCPVGYQVPHYTAVSGFTTTGDNTNTPFEWYDVRVENIADYDAATGTCGENGIYSKGLYEFYTNPDKLQSIIFPETGYRDWDDNVCAYQVDINAPIGYIWTAGNKQGDDNNSYNFEFARKDNGGASYIRPRNFFYPCDGFPIRPCVYDTHSTSTP